MHQKHPPAKVAVLSPLSSDCDESGGCARSETAATRSSATADRCPCVRHSHVLSAGIGSPVGTNRRARPLLHQRWPVGGGPSLKICPWCPLQRTQ